ncbi:carboxypeptidase regulatory-like domain-containing protein [Candidatus Bathyarchaeota archaeon]|nr:carboxypeptidase regulatory-like domain-containing protein [Candidatus Bathyarchaeota archaeon]
MYTRRSHVTKKFAIFLIFSILFLSLSPVHALAVTVSGRVIDEDGQGMKDVNIEVYAFDETYQVEVYVDSFTTSSDGSFSIALTVGKEYSLRFSKEGYVKVTKSLSVKIYGTGKVSLGEIVLNKAVKLSSTVLSLAANPGDKLLIPFVVSNIGGETETVEFSVSHPEDWSTRILDQASREIKKTELSSGVSLNLQLEVTIPLKATGCHTLTLTAASKTNSTLDFTIDVEPPSESILFCQFPGKSVAPGNTVRFQMRLKNPFGAEMRFKISVNSIPPSWTASIKTASGESISEVILGGNEFVDFIVEVESPENAKAGEEYSLTVIAESPYGNVTDSLPLSVALTEAEEDIRISAKFPEVTVEAGKALKYPITISNLGEIDRLLLLSVQPPTDWKVVFKSGTMEISRLYLEAGKSESLILEATPPSTVKIGTYTIPVQIKSPEGSIYAEMNLRATIIGSYELTLEPSTLLTSVTAGGSTTFTVKATNTGYTSVTSVSLNIAIPEDWESSVTPVQVDSLKPRESFSFNVVIKVPEDTVAGDYLITLTGLSDQVESDEVQVRITVTAPTSWGLIGIGLAVVMVIALVLIFMKFKRR